MGDSLCVLIVGGGTGGHVIPALAIADELRDRHGATVKFVGTARGFEARLVPQAGYGLELMEAGQLKGVSLGKKIRTLLDLPRGVLRCIGILDEFRPQVVIGVGGYASGPGMAAAILTRVPTLAFEPNAMPGLANRLIGKWVRAAAVNFAPAKRYFRDVEVTGIPVRREFFAPMGGRSADGPNLLIFGGSQGASVFNKLLPQMAPSLLEALPGLTILHQSGAKHLESTTAAYGSSGADPARWQVHAFLDDMPRRFHWADLVLARSGASTVAELGAAGKPALLIPFPAAADDHQRKNAEVMVEAGAAVMMIEAETTRDQLRRALLSLLADRPRLAEMAAQAKSLARPDAAERIAEMVIKLAQRSPKQAV